MISDPPPPARSAVQAIDGRRVDWIERAAVGMSTLCLVHCLALPVLLALLPGVSAWLHLPADLHRWLLMFAIPSSGFALLSGCRVHRSVGPLATGIAGLSAMALAALLLEGTLREVPVSVAGSLLLVAAHVSNWRARHRQCGCE